MSSPVKSSHAPMRGRLSKLHFSPRSAFYFYTSKSLSLTLLISRQGHCPSDTRAPGNGSCSEFISRLIFFFGESVISNRPTCAHSCKTRLQHPMRCQPGGAQELIAQRGNRPDASHVHQRGKLRILKHETDATPSRGRRHKSPRVVEFRCTVDGINPPKLKHPPAMW
jgi:hypothetical protein